MRKDATEKRRVLDHSWIRAASRTIASSVAELAEFAQAKTVACYLALPSEVQTRPLIDLCRKAGKAVRVPALDPENGKYRFAVLRPDETLVTGADRTEQPCSPCWADETETDVMIVPGVAFDDAGGRLGRGGGCYDTLLKNFRGTRIGLAFECQMVDEVPRDEQDETMDIVVTEKRILKIRY